MDMTFTLGSGLSAIVCTTALFLIQVRLRRLRKKRVAELELRPNCLLTRHPIVFVASPRSLFRLFEPWNDIPVYLKEHGYEVIVMDCPRKGSPARAIVQALETLKGKHHLIGDSSLEDVFTSLALVRHPQIATLTLARNFRTREFKRNRTSTIAARSVDDLKPLPFTLETLDLDSVAIPFKVGGWINAVSVLLLAAHNLFGVGRRPKVDPVETGQLIFNGWDIESRFLDLAISLAERDTQWSD